MGRPRGQFWVVRRLEAGEQGSHKQIQGILAPGLCGGGGCLPGRLVLEAQGCLLASGQKGGGGCGWLELANPEWRVAMGLSVSAGVWEAGP